MNHSVFDPDPYRWIMFDSNHRDESDEEPESGAEQKTVAEKLNDQFSHDMEMARQRAIQGFCDRDLWDIGAWFLELMPAMLQRFKEIRHGSPGFLGENYTDTDGILKNDTCHAEWDKILDEMIFLFRESVEDTCSQKNPHEEEHLQKFDEFMGKYGMLGEKLRTEEEKAEDERRNVTTADFMSEVPEYQEIDTRYDEEKQKLDNYREECRLKAMELFTKWMPHLWD